MEGDRCPKCNRKVHLNHTGMCKRCSKKVVKEGN